MSTDLVPTHTGVAEVTGLEKAKEIIQYSNDPTEIADIHALARAAAIYAEAQGAREQYMHAAELKLLAERKAGELRISFPRVYKRAFDREEARRLRESGMTLQQVGEKLGVSGPAIRKAEQQEWSKDGGKTQDSMRQFDETFNVSRATMLAWEKLAEIPEKIFFGLLTDAKTNDLAMTATSFLRKYGRSYEERVEPCIYRNNLDGRLVIKWTRNKINRSKILDTHDVSVARKELAEARGYVKQTVPKNATTLGDVYSFIRRALQTLDTLTPKLEPDARKATKAAISHLHKAEDEIIKASNAIPAGKLGRPKTRT